MTADVAALDGNDGGGYEQGVGSSRGRFSNTWSLLQSNRTVMRWDMALNDNSPWLQWSRDMNQLHGSTAAGIRYRWIQSGTGLLLSSQKECWQFHQEVRAET